MINKKENLPRFKSFKVVRNRNDNLQIKRSNVWKYKHQPITFFKELKYEWIGLKIIYYTSIVLISTIIALKCTHQFLPEIFFNSENLLAQTFLVFFICFVGCVRCCRMLAKLLAQKLDELLNFVIKFLLKYHFLNYHTYSTNQAIEARELIYSPKRKWHRGN